MPMRKRSVSVLTSALILLFLFSLSPTLAASLDPTEARIVEAVDRQSEEAIAALEQIVNINSGTMNPEGIRRVGAS